VYITEQDVSAIVPSVVSNVAFFAGEFEKGPVGTPYVITTKQDLERVFGRPTDGNYNQWYQAFKFFDYGDQLVVTRAYTETDLSETPTLSDNMVFVGAYENLAGDSSQGQIEMVFGNNVFNHELPPFQQGDWITLGNIQEIFIISSIDFVDPGTSTSECRVQVELSGDTTQVTDLEGAVWLHSASYKNGETQAFFRGPIDETSLTPTIPMAVDPDNIDYKDKDYQCFSNNRLNTTYELIKSDDDWDFYYTQDGNPLASFAPKAKLKFYTKTPTTEKVEVAVANFYDFKNEYDADGNPYNKSIAFRERVGDVYENIMLQDLFQYYPAEDQVAVAIKSGSTIETFICSFDPQSIDGNGRSDYIETVINEQSSLLYCLENSSIADLPASYLVCDRFGFDENGDAIGTATETLTVQGGKSPKVTVGDIRDAYFTVEDKEKYEIDVVIGNESVFQNIAIELADTRKDCIAFIGARYEDTVGKKAGDATNAIVKYITDGDEDGRKLTRTMFAAFFGNYFRIYDNYNKKYRWINCAGDMAGIRCSVSAVNESWWVSAGMKRGIIRGIDRMAFTPSQPMRDNLYKNGINPLVTFPGTGNLVWGNKTLLPYASAFDRINTRNLFNTLERAMAKAAKSEVFEFNDPYTRNALLAMFNPYLATIKAGRGITDYLVICDETNNTPDVISRNELRVDIYIKPIYASEFIQLNFVNVGTRSIATIVGA
jgi:hypothetical protein